MNFKKSKIRSLVLLALAAVAFCGLIWFANKDRPVYRSSNMAGTDYEVGRVLRVVEDHKTVDEEMDGIWRGSMTLEVEILTGRYKGDTAIVENYFSSIVTQVRMADGFTPRRGIKSPSASTRRGRTNIRSRSTIITAFRR